MSVEKYTTPDKILLIGVAGSVLSTAILISLNSTDIPLISQKTSEGLFDLQVIFHGIAVLGYIAKLVKSRV